VSDRPQYKTTQQAHFDRTRAAVSDTTNHCPLCEQAAKERDAARLALHEFRALIAEHPDGFDVVGYFEAQRDAAEAEAARHKAAVERLIDELHGDGRRVCAGCWAAKGCHHSVMTVVGFAVASDREACLDRRRKWAYSETGGTE